MGIREYLSAVVCVKNERRNLDHLLPYLSEFVGEVVVVDGGSRDGSREFAEANADVVVDDDGSGKGAAIRAGADAASLPICVFIDADLSHDPSEIPMMVVPLLTGKADLIIGSRSLGGSRELHGTLETFLRATGSHIILLAINWRFSVHLTDSQNGFRAIRSDLLPRLRLREPHTTIEQEMTVEALRRGYRVSDVPTHEYARFHGESKISLLRHSVRYVTSLFRMLLRPAIGRSPLDLEADRRWSSFVEKVAKSDATELAQLEREYATLLTGKNPAIGDLP